MTTGTMADWKELPREIVESVIRLLPVTDYIRFGAACRSWWSVVAEKYHSPLQQLPWLVLGEDVATKTRKVYNLSEQKLYHIGIPDVHERLFCASSSHGWLVTVDRKLSINLVNPFSGARIQLPSLRPYEVAYEKDPSSTDYTDEEIQDKIIYKMILSADPARCSDYKVMAIYGDNQRSAFWKPGDEDWTKADYMDWGRYEDAIWYKGEFYSVTCRDKVIIFDVQDTFPPRFRRMDPYHKGYNYGTRYLVDFMGDLLLVRRKMDFFGRDEDGNCHFRTASASVYKLDNIKGEWIHLESIGEHALFLGSNSSIWVCATDFPGCRKNSIYFTDDFYDGPQVFGCEDLGIYSLTDGSMESYYPTDVFHPTIFRPLWFQANPW